MPGSSLLALPFASVGGVIGLFITGEYLSVPASVGFIAVWGIAILNGVVLISFIKELREQGLSVAEAVRTGCEAALPSGADDRRGYILGLAPFLIATGLGSEVQKPLAIVVICGLITATVMTNVVVPMLYRYFDPLPDVPDNSITKLTDDCRVPASICRARYRIVPGQPASVSSFEHDGLFRILIVSHNITEKFIGNNRALISILRKR